LETLLEREITNYRQLKSLEAQKTQILIEGEIDNLIPLIQEQENLSQDLRLLEQRRRDLQAACAEENGMDITSTLGDLVKQTPESGGGLAFLRQELLDLVKDIDRSNRNNEVLLKQNLSHIKELFNIITGKSLKLSYGATGQNENLGQRVILDQSA